MSAAPTWVDDAALRAAVRGGWDEAEARWEWLQESAARAWAGADARRARALWDEALILARDNFAAPDGRLGASWANVGWAGADDAEDAEDKFAQAEGVWALAPLWIDRMAPAGRGRSSLHHLRMERKNKAVYQTAAKKRLQAMADEARRRLQSRRGIALSEWQNEKPAAFDDTRKVLSACYLMLPLHSAQ